MMSEKKPFESERQRDKTVEDTFPASDPPANSGITGAEPPETTSTDANTDAIPTGRPISDRYGMETAHHSEEDTAGTEDGKS